MDTDFAWEDPPEVRKRRTLVTYDRGANTDIGENLARLVSQPGRWGFVWFGGGESTDVRAKKYREADCQVRIVSVPGVGRKLYARWLG